MKSYPTSVTTVRQDSSFGRSFTTERASLFAQIVLARLGELEELAIDVGPGSCCGLTNQTDARVSVWTRQCYFAQMWGMPAVSAESAAIQRDSFGRYQPILAGIVGNVMEWYDFTAYMPRPTILVLRPGRRCPAFGQTTRVQTEKSKKKKPRRTTIAPRASLLAIRPRPLRRPRPCQLP
jgi:hypothetical protein